MPFNPHNILPLLGSLFPEDALSQSQTQDNPPQKPSEDAHRRIEMTSLINHISKALVRMSPEQREYFP